MNDFFIHVILLLVVFFIWLDARRCFAKAKHCLDCDVQLLEKIKKELNEIRNIKNG